MADYISALNGQQMDAALTEVALYNPEAWAVGQRNGVPVTSADETWHNNAKYYAQVAQSAIPGTYTAAVRWDIDQGLAGEAQEQARANISAGASNRNLLDNPFFTVRQMGTGGVTGVGYAVDRWKNTGGANLTQTPRSPYGITFASSSGYQVDQALWDYPAEYLVGKTFTLSIMTSGGNIAQATGIFTAASSAAAKVAVTSADGNFTVGLYYNTSARAIPFVRITTPSGRFPVNAAILAVKLELGSYSTLANDVPPDYGEELRKCQRYFIRIKGDPVGFGYVSANLTVAYILIPTPVAMYKTPSYSINGSVYVRGTGGTWNSSTISVLANQPPNGINITVPVSASQVMAVGLYPSSTNSYIDFTADL